MTLPWRDAVRALLIDDSDRILLVRFRWGRWATPGGGLLPHEPHELALRRELAEEVGLDDPPLGPWIWTREHAFDDLAGYCGQRERYYLVRVASFVPAPRVDLAAEHVTDVKWWTAAELAASAEAFSPRRLPALVADLLAHGPPVAPLDVGV